MRQLKPLESMILTIRDRKVIIDADLATLYDVPTKALNQAIRRNRDRFPGDFVFRLTTKERAEVVTNCDHLRQAEVFSNLADGFYRAWGHHGCYSAEQPAGGRHERLCGAGVRAPAEHIAVNQAILKRLAEIDRTLLEHDSTLLDLYEKLLPLRQPLPDQPNRRIGFQSKGKL